VPAAVARDRFRRWWPLLALLIAGAARWIVTDTHPEAGSTLASEALGCAWAALLVWAIAPRSPGRKAGSPWKTLLAGAMLVGGPVTALLAHAPLVDPGGLTMALALTPVVVAVASAALSRGQSDDVAGRLWPGLAAIAGLLLVLVTPSLSDARNDLILALTPLLTGIGAAWLCAQSSTTAGKLRIGLAGAAALFAAAALAGWPLSGRPTFSVVAVAWDGVIALLSLLTLVQLGTTRWSAQFVLLPLLILLEGIVLMHPPLTLRLDCGLTLLAVASLYLLLRREDEPTPSIA
jgi:drug/metabolite transporter (DMT)-like permease